MRPRIELPDERKRPTIRQAGEAYNWSSVGVGQALERSGSCLVHRKSLVGFRAACQQMWGASGYESLCRDLPADVRERTAGMRPLPDWNPLGDLIAWHLAVWNGPAKRDETIMTRHTFTRPSTRASVG